MVFGFLIAAGRLGGPASAAEVVLHRDLYASSGGQSFKNLVRDAAGTLYCVSVREGDEGRRELIVQRSSDGGASWEDAPFIFNDESSGLVPPEATAPALIFVGFLMLKTLRVMEWDDVTVAVPAFLILVAMPLTYSTSHGIGYGFIAYAVVSLLAGRGRQVHPVMYIVAAVFALSFTLAPA